MSLTQVWERRKHRADRKELSWVFIPNDFHWKFLLAFEWPRFPADLQKLFHVASWSIYYIGEARLWNHCKIRCFRECTEFCPPHLLLQKTDSPLSHDYSSLPALKYLPRRIPIYIFNKTNRALKPLQNQASQRVYRIFVPPPLTYNPVRTTVEVRLSSCRCP